MSYRARITEVTLDAAGHQLNVTVEFFGNAGEPLIRKVYQPEGGMTRDQLRDTVIRPYIAKLNTLEPLRAALKTFADNGTVINE